MVQSVKKISPAFFVVAGLYLLASLYRLQDIPPPWYDEMVHLNTAGHLASEGKIWCDFYTSKFNGVLFNGMPLHWILLGIFVKIFGISLAGARFFYVLLSALTLFCVYSLAKKLFDEKTALYSIISLAACYIFFHNSRQVMPYVPAALFSVMALLVFYAAKEKNPGSLFVLSGFLTALAYLSHPTGIGIFFVIIALFLYKKIPARFFWLYLTGMVFTAFPYIVYVAANFQEYLRQTNFILKGLYPQQNIFLNILDEIPVRYFGLPHLKNVFETRVINNNICNEYFYLIKWCATSLDLRVYFCEVMAKAPLILSLVYLCFKKNKTEGQRDLFLITILCVLIESFHPNKFGPYIYLAAPFLTMCLSVSYRELMKKDATPKKYNMKRAAAILLLAAFLSSNFIFIYKELTSKKIRGYEGYIGEISSFIPKGSTVAAPVYFWLGMHKYYDFVSANEIVYEIDKIMKTEWKGIVFESLPVKKQEGVIKMVLARHKIQYCLITCHYWEDITEVPGPAVGAGRALRRHLFYSADKEKDYLRLNFYKDAPRVIRFEDETYEPPAGSGGFNNVSEEYQKSLKIYRVKQPFYIS
jgi:uncharacterized membrane protein